MSTVWKDKKRTIFGLPLSFTRYELTEEKSLINTGVLNVSEDEIRLYRFVDMTLKQSLGQRIFGVGDICCQTTDRSSGNFVIKSVKKPREVKDMLSDLVEAERDKKRVAIREVAGSQPDDFDQDRFDPDDFDGPPHP